MALTEEFIEDPVKQRQWNAFQGKTLFKKEAVVFLPLINGIRAFLQPPLAALAEGKTFELQWSRGWSQEPLQVRRGTDSNAAKI